MNMPIQGTDAWLRARQGKLTASVIGKVITGKGKDEVLRDMVREAMGYPRAFTGNVATDYGHAHEDEARTEYALETGNAVVETGFHLHPEHDWLGASPDGLIRDNGLLELKCPYKLRDADSVPDDLIELGREHVYWHQMQAQMAVMGRAWCDFAVWCPGGISVRRYPRDDGWLGWALDTCLPFMAYLRDVLADPEEAERIADMQRDMSDDEDWLKVALQYAALDEEIKRRKAEQDELRKALVEMAGERKAIGGGVQVIPVKRTGGIDTKRLGESVNLDDYRKPDTLSWQVRVS
ncbi:putative phage-type endonuclease [Modicisalibacter xianhensis]|uniref:Putative phage-type endonuclease n=1 Tax=Modicisalibacter xianhensis TaxID=442341 RepID=A0A4V3GUH7_9GAMM|nr:lambda exonuclease family protein [Halomonas xianhensis]TDX30801.1 putative phage-type endonuclease [Halomonas xianhensis]